MQAQASFEQLVSQASENGWDFFDGPTPGEAKLAQARAEAERGRRVAQMAARLALDPEFREVLDFLADATLRRVTFVTPPLMEAMSNYAYGCFREGQNAAVFSIFKLIAQGRDEALKGRDT